MEIFVTSECKRFIWQGGMRKSGSLLVTSNSFGGAGLTEEEIYYFFLTELGRVTYDYLKHHIG